MNKYSKLAKNTGVFLIASFGSKILSFLMVRFYTELLSTQEFGVIDLLNTTASLAFPVVTLCITEAVLRFSIDDLDNRGKILTNGLMVTLFGNLVFMLIAPILSKVEVFSENVIWLLLLTLTNSFYAIITHFSRGIGKTKLFAVSGFVYTIIQISLNVLFLVVFNWGIKGYLIASILTNVVTTGIVFISGNLHAFILRSVDKKLLRQMLLYSIPLIPNLIFWWIMQSMDRYAITYMLSASDNGLYAVANKIPTLITAISAVFFQAWQIASVEELNSDQKDQFYSNVFEGLSSLLVLSASFIMVILQPLYRLLTEKTYYGGWTCTPFLLCAMVFSCYASFLGTNYVAMKKTKGVFLTTIVGAIVNMVLNIALIPLIGIEGAALATLIAFVITWGSRVIGTKKYVKIKYPFLTFTAPSLLMVLQATVLTLGVYSITVQVLFFVVIVLLYLKRIITTTKRAYDLIKNKWKRTKPNDDYINSKQT